MVDVVQSNEKLRSRALHIVMEATGADPETARKMLDLADGRREGIFRRESVTAGEKGCREVM